METRARSWRGLAKPHASKRGGHGTMGENAGDHPACALAASAKNPYWCPFNEHPPGNDLRSAHRKGTRALWRGTNSAAAPAHGRVRRRSAPVVSVTGPLLQAFHTSI